MGMRMIWIGNYVVLMIHILCSRNDTEQVAKAIQKMVRCVNELAKGIIIKKWRYIAKNTPYLCKKIIVFYQVFYTISDNHSSIVL